LREVELEVRQYLLAYFDSSIEKSEKMRTVFISSTLDIATTISKISGECLKVLGRVERCFLQVVKETLGPSQCVTTRKRIPSHLYC
jgi:hypothetical protein